MRNQGLEELTRAGLVYQYQDTQNFYRVSVSAAHIVTLERVLHGPELDSASERSVRCPLKCAQCVRSLPIAWPNA